MQRKQTTALIPTYLQVRAGSIHSECSPLDSGLQAVQVEVVQVEVVQAEVVQVEVVQAGLRGGLG